MNETEIFLSYAREDESEVERILHALRERGFRVFFDQDMPSGVDWESVLEAKLRSAYGVVVVWSSHSVKSDWVVREAAVGLEKDRLFPIRTERGVDLPSSFAHKQAVDLSNWNGDPKDPKFDRVLGLLQPLWEAQVGTLHDIKVFKPIRFKPRPAPPST